MESLFMSKTQIADMHTRGLKLPSAHHQMVQRHHIDGGPLYTASPTVAPGTLDDLKPSKFDSVIIADESKSAAVVASSGDAAFVLLGALEPKVGDVHTLPAGEMSDQSAILTETQQILGLGALLDRVPTLSPSTKPTVSPTSELDGLARRLDDQKEKLQNKKASCVAYAKSQKWNPVICELSKQDLLDRQSAMKKHGATSLSHDHDHSVAIGMANKVLWLAKFQMSLAPDLKYESFLEKEVARLKAHADDRNEAMMPYKTQKVDGAKIPTVPTPAPKLDIQQEDARIEELQGALEVTALNSARDLDQYVPGAEVRVKNLIDCILKVDETSTVEQIRTLCKSAQFENPAAEKSAKIYVPRKATAAELAKYALKRKTLAKKYRAEIIASAVNSQVSSNAPKLRGLLRALLESMGIVTNDCNGRLKESTCDIGEPDQAACMKCIKSFDMIHVSKETQERSKCTEAKLHEFCGVPASPTTSPTTSPTWIKKERPEDAQERKAIHKQQVARAEKVRLEKKERALEKSHTAPP
jgi:hypothetical protein